MILLFVKEERSITAGTYPDNLCAYKREWKMNKPSKIILILILLYLIPGVSSVFAQDDKPGVDDRREYTDYQRQGGYWQNAQKSNGLRLHFLIGGYNLWYKDDPGYVYSDLVGSWFSGETGRLFDLPTVGVDLQWTPPHLGIFILTAVVATARISFGGGVGIPILINRASAIAPWVTINLAFANGFTLSSLLETGIEVRNNRFLFGVTAAFLNIFSARPDDWLSLYYGLSIGIKIK
ncbi:hypothetical protein FACS189473_5540 [Spirochaetia bacterium]|nr:hypothetical protein FACS189473_5540 [Spirochaetia bacterium]